MSLLCLQLKTPDGGQRNCPKHVDFYYKNNFGKLVHVVGFITRIYSLRLVCLSVLMEQLGSHWTEFHKIRYLSCQQPCVT